MEKNTRGNKKALTWLLVINPKENSPVEAQKQQLEGYLLKALNYNVFKYVFATIHDKDKQDNGEPKTIHAHVVMVFEEEISKSALLDELTELLNCNTNQLSLEPSNSDILGVQYLTHKNHPEKAQYPYEEIKANDYEELKRRYNAKYRDRYDEIKNALFESPTMTALIEKVGLDNAKKYQSIFNQIAKEKDEIKTTEQLGMQLAKTERLLHDTHALLLKLITNCKNALTRNEKRLINLEDIIKAFDDLENEIFK